MDIGLPRKAVFDDDDLRIEGHFAFGKAIKGIDDLFGILSAGELDLNFDISCCVVVDRLDLDFALFGGFVDRADETFCRRSIADFSDDKGFGIFDLDFCAEFDLASALCHTGFCP